MKEPNSIDPSEENPHKGSIYSIVISNSLEESTLSNPFTPTQEVPPIPKRPEEESIPKAYTLGYDELLANDDLEYGDQSYINNDVMRNPPPIPAPLSPQMKKDLLEEDATPAQESVEEPTVEVPPEIVLPPEMDVDASFKEGSLDELIGLVPEKEEKKNMKDLLTKVKGQTSNMIQKIFRRSSQDKSTDLLGIQTPDKDVKENIAIDPFANIPESAPVEGGNISNEDVDDLFGMVSLDAMEAEHDSPTEISQESEGRHFFNNAADHYNLFLSVLALGKLVNQEEMEIIREAGERDRKNVLRILQNYLEKGEDIEFNRLLNRTVFTLPPDELKLKVVKEANGHRYEIKRVTAITLSVPKIFVFNDTFFFLAEMRNSKINIFNQWNPCVVQLTRYQLRVFKNLADIPQENTIMRVNLNQLMLLTNVQSKTYKQSMYHYVKLFENDLWNHRVLESKPVKFRPDLSSILRLKLGSKDEIVLRTLAYQLQLRIKSIHNQEKVEF